MSQALLTIFGNNAVVNCVQEILGPDIWCLNPEGALPYFVEELLREKCPVTPNFVFPQDNMEHHVFKSDVGGYDFVRIHVPGDTGGQSPDLYLVSGQMISEFPELQQWATTPEDEVGE